MSAGTAWLLVAIAVASSLWLYWYDHPGVRLKRQIRQRLQREKHAQEELDDRYEQAKASMDRLADGWDER